MTAQELREKFLKYFEERGHTIIPSASLVPENDPTILFTTAGMHPLVPYLTGEKHPGGKRLADVQKCIRTDDIDEVGDKIHHTFFEMLGNWSLGDYFKEDTVSWSFEFLTTKAGLDLPIERLAVSVFAGDEDAPFDETSYKLWQDLGIAPNRIAKLPKKNNWWGPAGETGPCGPDTEMFVWTGRNDAPENFQETCDDENWVEIWNDVFMQYNKVRDDSEYSFKKLAQHNVDTGMGLERALAVLNDTDDNYRTDIFWPMIIKIEELTGLKYGDKTDEEYIADDLQCWLDVRREMRIIADHIKAATFAISDGAMPSNKGAGYIVRRLIRRAIVKAKNGAISKAGEASTSAISGDFIADLADCVYEIYGDLYFESKEKFGQVLETLKQEEAKFNKALNQGLKEFEKNKQNLNGEIAFNLYQSYGFPLEMTVELAEESNIKVDVEEFKIAFKTHQELSRTASAGMFKGGLADDKEATARLHTAAHLMLAALRQVLGDHVLQKGSNITADRLRFDFSHTEKMTPEQIEEVEELVNEQISKDVPVEMAEMSLEDAKACGAMGIFDSKYGDKVKVYTVDNFSKEICGGPHVAHTGELGRFKIKKEESSSAGVRRIKAVLE